MIDAETVGRAAVISYAAVELSVGVYNLMMARYVNWRYRNQPAGQRVRHLESRLVSFGPFSAGMKLVECSNVEYDWVHWESESLLQVLFRKNL